MSPHIFKLAALPRVCNSGLTRLACPGKDQNHRNYHQRLCSRSLPYMLYDHSSLLHMSGAGDLQGASQFTPLKLVLLA